MAHAILSPSSAHRWMQCTPSARLEQQFPDSSSSAAEEGTLAHELAETRLSIHFNRITPTQYASIYTRIKDNPLFSSEMEEYVDSYASFVLEKMAEAGPEAEIFLEDHIDLTRYIPEAFGTIDAIIMADGTLYIIDLKYGKGVEVFANDNEQLMIYALGALDAYGTLYDITDLELNIYQPRLANYSTFRISAQELQEWGEKTLKPRAKIAFKGEGLLKVGDHCRFCRAKAVCRAQKEQAERVMAMDFREPHLLSESEIAQVLSWSDQVSSWLNALSAYALEQALQGVRYAGWKVVEGRSIRQYKEQDAVVQRLVDGGWKEELLFERKLLGITAMEKLVGKKKFNELLAGLVEKPPGKPTLVPDTDKREPLRDTQIKEDFS